MTACNLRKKRSISIAIHYRSRFASDSEANLLLFCEPDIFHDPFSLAVLFCEHTFRIRVPRILNLLLFNQTTLPCTS